MMPRPDLLLEFLDSEEGNILPLKSLFTEKITKVPEGSKEGRGTQEE
jgi:hypothetical protein